MRRVLVVTWALGTATGVLLGLFGVELVSSRFSTAGVSPLSHPEVLRALEAARSGPPSAGGVALPAPAAPDTTVPPAVDAGPARPSAGPTSSSASAPPASTLPRPGATAETLTAAASPAGPTTSTGPPPESSTTTSTAAPVTTVKPKSDPKGKGSSSSTSSCASKLSSTCPIRRRSFPRPDLSQDRC